MHMSTAAALAGLLVIAACKIERTRTDELADAGSVARADIDNTLELYQQSLSAGETRRATSFFTPDAILNRSGAPEAQGRGAIGDAFEEIASGGASRIALTSESIDLLAGGAYQMGTFEESVAGDSAVRSGRFVIRWLRGPESTWRIHRLLMSHAPADSTVAN